MKRQVRATRSTRFGPLDQLEGRQLLTMTTAAALPPLEFGTGASPSTIDLDSYFKDKDAAANDYAMVNTSGGTIPVLLDKQDAPSSVAGFLAHVSKGDYANTLVDRSVAGSLWQAGGSQLTADAAIRATPGDAPITADVGGSNVRGTVALVRDGAGGATSSGELLFNEADNSATLDHQPGGSAVFGRVVGTGGAAVLDAIGAIPVPAQSPLSGSLAETPLQLYTAGAPLQAYNLTTIKDVTTAGQFFEVQSDNPNVAQVAVTGDQLMVTPGVMGTAHVAVVGYGADGTPAAESFTVDVEGWPTAANTPAPNTTTLAGSVAPPLATPVTPPSVAIPSTSGPLPSTVVAGQRAHISQTVTLTSPSTTGTRNQTISLSLANAATGARYTIGTTTAAVHLAVGKPAKVRVSAARIGKIPAGAYHLQVTVADVDGGSTTVTTGRTITVMTPTAR